MESSFPWMFQGVFALEGTMANLWGQAPADFAFLVSVVHRPGAHDPERSLT